MPRVISRVPFKFDGKELERGELFELDFSKPRARQLLGLKYFVVFDVREHEDHMCDKCGKKFASENFYVMHKKKAGGCLGPSSPITRAETAMLLDADPDKVKVED